jgi:hypothetical protein
MGQPPHSPRRVHTLAGPLTGRRDRVCVGVVVGRTHSSSRVGLEMRTDHVVIARHEELLRKTEDLTDERAARLLFIKPQQECPLANLNPPFW